MALNQSSWTVKVIILKMTKANNTRILEIIIYLQIAGKHISTFQLKKII